MAQQRKALFISFEGGEGSGKTTQVNRLAEFLTAQGYKAITTREPGGTPDAEKIRDFIVQRSGGDWSSMAECLLLYAARALHVEQIIKPALAREKIVITDRFSDSTLAYQGYGRGLPLDDIRTIDKTVLKGFGPDLTFLLDIPPTDGLSRSGRRLAAEALHIQQAEDRFENLPLDFHEKLRAGFLEIAAAHPARFVVLDARQTPDALAAAIQKSVLERLS